MNLTGAVLRSELLMPKADQTSCKFAFAASSLESSNHTWKQAIGENTLDDHHHVKYPFIKFAPNRNH